MLEAKRWIDYYSKFGTQHLQAGAHKIPLWQKLDLDIKLMVGLVVLAAFLAVRMLLETCFKRSAAPASITDTKISKTD